MTSEGLRIHTGTSEISRVPRDSDIEAIKFTNGKNEENGIQFCGSGCRREKKKIRKGEKNRKNERNKQS